MGVLSDLIIANVDEAHSVAASDEPTRDWDGFSFKGLDNVKLATLMSIQRCGTRDGQFEFCLDAVQDVAGGSEDGPVVFAVSGAHVATLSKIATMDDVEVEALAETWSATEEFEGWEFGEVLDLLRSIGDLAETACLQDKSLLLWIAL